MSISTLFPLYSDELYQQSTHFAQASRYIYEQITAHQTLYAYNLNPHHGQAINALKGRLYTLHRTWDTTASSYQRTATILHLAAGAQKELEVQARWLINTATQYGAVYENNSFHNVQDQWDIATPANAVLQFLRQASLLLDKTSAHTLLKENDLPTDIDPVAFRLKDLDLLDSDSIHDLNMIVAENEIRELLHKYPNARLLETGDGHTVVSFGDIDTATNIVTLVAGVNSHNNVASYLQRTDLIHNHTASSSSATVLWLGYRAPKNISKAFSGAPAQAAAKDLQEFQHILTQRNPTARRVLIGHSYGSTVVGYAGLTNTQNSIADAVILAGSPGVPARPNASEVYSVLANQDYIGLTGANSVAIHGVDPHASTFDSEKLRFDGGHSSYFDNQKFLDLIKRVRSSDTQ
ncbi:Alpha/beta hydrolase [Corynebacterium kutscheri]|uniref:Alpha/beta hydrolase n=1 Tax=Corynebacterium kutscheri TaxID=35755 RepID=A0A0F6R1S6_9CORY|nr:alpha/beta hydrolase [Corynebacterium kutscheri]AKE42040.1 Alpha/beta hydrolase [Corynebacterium kutscheri]VEH06109.1 Alpha/beta hydrolase of uncharacterised function (DUF1023) [Corynebacterium kutscheri]VEH10381.1 Alpha/beta hydrolase of uncharacterised function (DUF1023) [Corynebacterium kutscheri]